MDKINESMEKIGAMLGVQPTSSNLAGSVTDATSVKEAKQEPLIQKEEPKAEPPQIVAVSSAEGKVVGPPVTKSGNDTVYTTGTGMSRPTKPGKTKTTAGAAIASFAAAVDNTVNKVNKSVRKLGGYECGDDMERGDGSTVTEYVSIEKPRRFGETPKWVYCCVLTALAILVSLAVSAAVPGTSLNSWFQDVNNDIAAQHDGNISVAFVGNSYLFVNDVPRVMESISKGRIQQQSVINTAAGLGSLLKQGNGMFELWGEDSPNAADYWQTFDFHALMESANIDVDEDYVLRDYGYCTVPQLLDGYDNYLSYRNQNGVYLDVGTNPCFEDEYYLMIMQEKSYSDPMYFDYVVLNDQTRRMVNEDGREDSLDALVQAYAPLLKTSRAIPILVDTHAFGVDFEDFEENEYYDDQFEDAEDAAGEQRGDEVDYEEYYQDGAAANMNQYQDRYYGKNSVFDDEIPQFTAAIYEGLYEYRDALKENLPERQWPRIAKIGLAYLAIYEDDLSMYAKLFAEDGIHASQHGTYLFACILYATIYGHLPLAPHDDFDVRSLFFRSRALFGNNTGTPTQSEAQYLRKWARKIQVEGYTPRSMVFPEEEEEEVAMWNMTDDQMYNNGDQQ